MNEENKSEKWNLCQRCPKVLYKGLYCEDCLRDLDKARKEKRDLIGGRE